MEQGTTVHHAAHDNHPMSSAPGMPLQQAGYPRIKISKAASWHWADQVDCSMQQY
jgi:hypothetical protein